MDPPPRPSLEGRGDRKSDTGTFTSNGNGTAAGSAGGGFLEFGGGDGHGDPAAQGLDRGGLAGAGALPGAAVLPGVAGREGAVQADGAGGGVGGAPAGVDDGGVHVRVRAH